MPEARRLRSAVAAAAMVAVLLGTPASGSASSREDLPRLGAAETESDSILLMEFQRRYRKTHDLERFHNQVRSWYSESTLRQLVRDRRAKVRVAALLGLQAVGTMESNGSVAAAFTDPDPAVRNLARQVCWSIWFRGGTQQQNQRLVEIVRESKTTIPSATLQKLDELVSEAPGFAEAINQRAIVLFQMDHLEAALRDCRRVLRLNPFHFGAQEGMCRCYLLTDRPQEALQAYLELQKLRPDSRHVKLAIEELRTHGAEIGGGSRPSRESDARRE